jgi:multicomponent Na+:H+ antiporter subunit E
VVLAVLWASLTPGDLASWWLGVPAVLGGAAVPLLLPARNHRRLRLSPVGTLTFAFYFLVQSVRGAADVAWRACLPQMPIDPGFRAYTMALPEGAAQFVMANAITLLPGTLSAEVNGQTIIVHMLDQTADLTAELGELEARVAGLFGLTLSGQEQPA